MKPFSILRRRSPPLWKTIPYQRMQHVALSGSKQRSGADRLMGELAFMFLRVVVRNSGRFIGYLWRNGSLNRNTVIVIAGVPVVIFGGLIMWKGEHIPYSNRLHLVFLDHDEEAALAQEAAEEVLKKEGKNLLPARHALYQTSQTIAANLVETCRRDGLLPSHLDFKLHIIESPIPNAFVLPNGHIFIYTGILPIARTEGGLACILGHEIAHALSRHAAERIGYLKMCILLYEFIMGISEGHDGYRMWKHSLIEFLLVTLLQIGLPLAHSRYVEEEADKVGLRLAARSGYDPLQAVEVWKRMMKLQTKQEEVDSSDNKQPTATSSPEAQDGKTLIPSSSDHPPSSSSNKCETHGESADSLSLGTRISELFSTHPCHERRIIYLRDLADGGEVGREFRAKALEMGKYVPDSHRLLEWGENGGKKVISSNDVINANTKKVEAKEIPEAPVKSQKTDEVIKDDDKSAVEEDGADNTTNNSGSGEDIWNLWAQRTKGVRNADLVQSAVLAQDASMLMVGPWRKEVHAFLGKLNRQDVVWRDGKSEK
eukprot:gene25079-30292_t